MTFRTAHRPDPSSEEWRTWQRVQDSYENAWQSRRPSPEEFLAAGAEPWQVAQLVGLDLRHRLRDGEAARVEEYLERFPVLQKEAAAVLELIEAEYELRQAEGVTRAEYERRFPTYREELAALLPDDTGRGGAYATLQDGGGGAQATWPPAVGAYDILGELGSGGMGIVYKARHQDLGRVVALKMIQGTGRAHVESVRRFRTEARAIARLQHPNVVQIYDIGEHEGCPYFALELCEGGSLSTYLNGTPVSPRDAARLVETLARALQAAHEQHVIHRDLKPANVLLSPAPGDAPRAPAREGERPPLAAFVPKVTDFGLAKHLDEAGQTASGALLGTPSYMAPEQVSGAVKDMNAAVDVYGLGAILYECLTGRPPFQGATALATLARVAMGELTPPTQLNPHVPPDLNAICLKCLAREPAQRYASAAALAEDLRRHLGGQSTRARPWSFGERLRKRGRQLALAALAAVLVLVVLRAAFPPGPEAEPGVPQGGKAGGQPAGVAKAGDSPVVTGGKKLIAANAEKISRFAHAANTYTYKGHEYLGHKETEDGYHKLTYLFTVKGNFKMKTMKLAFYFRGDGQFHHVSDEKSTTLYDPFTRLSASYLKQLRRDMAGRPDVQGNAALLRTIDRANGKELCEMYLRFAQATASGRSP